ncbi:MAG TPA: methylenetetrahydrofolate--tRNA-(uracil(54)-C(5))-methyltransferase (FADH(2)-oxidizing) TrmFO [Bacillota bacterium]|nr:methylenetetrahydrofolate--tRNA-(uracil(54)-C(5))-methyltransferase (FADH(2)-oxidizing) TrmFO [Bacillota bacterium]
MPNEQKEKRLRKKGTEKVKLTVVGAGLAGSEAALTAASLGAMVTLIEMKPGSRSPAHASPCFAELVCSNSLKSDRLDTAQGLLKHELRALGSHLISIADETSVAAGGALAVDRELFSRRVTDAIMNHPSIRVVERTVNRLEEVLDGNTVIVSTGPLTSGALYDSIEEFTGEGGMHFFDAAAPVIDASTIDRTASFAASRYGKGGDDYINCPLDESEYLTFREALLSAEKAHVHAFDHIYFKDCQPIEVLAERGIDTMRYGPFRPVGLIDPGTGKRPYACLQLRKEDEQGTMVSLVGCQTRLTFPEQRRVFRMIPALKDARFLRYGVMHRNSFLKGPAVLSWGFRSRRNGKLLFAGQLSGLEGYVEAIASGLMAALCGVGIEKGLSEEDLARVLPGRDTMMGALARWVSGAPTASFQPMNANFGLLSLPEDMGKIKKKYRPDMRVRLSEQSQSHTVHAIEELFGTTEKDSPVNPDSADSADEAEEGCNSGNTIPLDMLTSSYTYHLPPELIASHPVDVRDASRLLVMKSGLPLEHRVFSDLPSYLSPGDCLVLNDTRVIPARLFGTRKTTGGKLEFLLLRCLGGKTWRVMVKPARRARTGEQIVFSEGGLEGVIVGEEPDGVRIIELIHEGELFDWLDQLGEMPTPPYIKEKLREPERYQTVYADKRGSAAAPTAGLHFTERLLADIESSGVKIARLTLHVGLGTFKPVTESIITDHPMHDEWFVLGEDAARIVSETKREGGRVIAVGTTSCRVLESVAADQAYGDHDAPLQPASGETDLFIYPGFRFRVIDAMITNFHLPGSTLLMLVSALMGRVEMLAAYREAVNAGYRFFSFGDAMLLLPRPAK